MVDQRYGPADLEDVRPTPTDRIVGTEADMRPVRNRFGGTDLVAISLGMFAALGVLAFLVALIAAGGGDIAFQLNALDADGTLADIEVVGSLVAVAVVFTSFLGGGWAAGRIARYDGGLNGLLASLFFILLVAVFAALGQWIGDEYNAFALADLPNWIAQFDADDVTMKAVAAAAAGIVAALLGGYLGGVLGEQYHRKADAAVVQVTAVPETR